MSETNELPPLPEPYCLECGSEEMDCIEQYSNGTEYKCRTCGTARIWASEGYRLTSS